MGAQSAKKAASLMLDEPVEAPNRAFYAVLDGARSPDVHEAVAESGLPSMCLFRGPIAPELEKNAPWLVRLERTSPNARELVVEAWGKSWGIFAETFVDLAVLGRHLRGFLRVRAPDGRRMLFRFYDPRVWRRFLPTLTAAEAKQLGGPVRRFLTEDEDGRVVHEDVPGPDGSSRRTIRLEPAPIELVAR